MENSIAFSTDTSKISLDKMNFTITNLRPKNTNKAIHKEIENKLFNVFKKYT